jgi:predicted amidophosphoribosyltransferase
MVQRGLAGRVPHLRSYAFLQYRNGSIVQQMLHQLKYYGREEVGQELGYLFGKELTSEIGGSAYLVPVPLHYKKHRSRGFNQCDAICSGLALALKAEVLPHLLTRVKNKGSLTKLNRAQRAEATASLYEANLPPLGWVCGDHLCS